jgi:hypothetical protein
MVLSNIEVIHFFTVIPLYDSILCESIANQLINLRLVIYSHPSNINTPLINIYQLRYSIIPKDFAALLITDIISTESGPLQSPFPPLDLSSRCYNLSRALSPKHAKKSAGSCSWDPLLAPVENRL